MKFKPIERQSASSECAAALRRAILAGDMQAGQRLPPERRLAEDFGVNRLTLRAALAQLLAVGLVTVKQGSGYTVADVARVGGLDLLPEIVDMARDADELLQLVSDLLNVRRSLASSVLGRLSEMAGEEDFAKLEAAIDEFEAIANQGNPLVSAFVDADFAIVAAMVDGARSPILRMCLNPVIQAVAQISELAGAMYVDPQDNLSGHRLLLAWLRNPTLAPLKTIIDELAKRDEHTIHRMRAMQKEIA
jgi:GntR family transcriptional repressor for pyruvate dehydrogenase complex